MFFCSVGIYFYIFVRQITCACTIYKGAPVALGASILPGGVFFISYVSSPFLIKPTIRPITVKHPFCHGDLPRPAPCWSGTSPCTSPSMHPWLHAHCTLTHTPHDSRHTDSLTLVSLHLREHLLVLACLWVGVTKHLGHVSNRGRQ